MAVNGNSQLQKTDTVSSNDLRQEAENLGVTYRIEFYKTCEYNEENLEMLWLPDINRAGIAWGADASWTDAASPQDALERFFGVDEKEMNN